MAVEKQFENKHYGGPESERPAQLPYGDTYFSSDTKNYYKYDVTGVGVKIGPGAGGESGGGSGVSDHTLLSNIGIKTHAELDAQVDLNNAKVSNIDHPLVEAAVPVGALFSDTIYTDADTESYIKANATSSTKEVLAIVAGFVSWIGTESNLYELTLTGDCTLENPSAPIDGAGYTFRIKQDGTGSHTLSYGTNWKFPGGIAPAITLDPNAKDYVSVIMDGIELDSVPLQNML